MPHVHPVSYRRAHTYLLMELQRLFRALIRRNYFVPVGAAGSTDLITIDVDP